MECTVHTTIEVERLFSLVNVTKTNKRDRMKTQTLEALMTVKKNLPRIQDLCTNFPEFLSKAVVTKLVSLRKITIMYSKLATTVKLMQIVKDQFLATNL